MGLMKKFKKVHKKTPLSGTALDPDAPLGLPSASGMIEGMTGEAAEDAAKEASRLRRAYSKEALAEQQRQFDITKRQQQPFVDVGRRQLSPLQAAATPEGYANAIQAAMQGDLPDLRNEAAMQFAQQAGLRRDVSGLGDLDVSESMSLEDMLNRRKQSLAGMSQTSSSDLAGRGQRMANASGRIMTDTGRAIAGDTMNAALAKAQGVSNMANLVGAGISAYGNYGGTSVPSQAYGSTYYGDVNAGAGGYA